MDADHILVTPSMFGPMSAQQVAEHLKDRVFHCEMCSDMESKVYHNIIGEHAHALAAEVRARFPQ